MEIADDVAYGVHDLEDGIARKLLVRESVGPSIEEAAKYAGFSKIDCVPLNEFVDELFSEDSCKRKGKISHLVKLFVTSVEIKRLNVFDHPLIDFRACLPPDLQQFLDDLKKKVTFERIVARREVQTLEYKGERIISDLFDALAERPSGLVGEKLFENVQDGLSKKVKEFERDGGWQASCCEPVRSMIARSISDFIAGMTNPYAEKFHRRLFEPGFGSSTDDL